ncbi:Eukaryotic translation initiation factor 4B [Malassezia caprae]|uniref:Eukaryotic translation initiation factor 4B n=1 Tax=Malassezia caprae TaxID=1381934 RepID=A0AAF0E5E2_9BASI|nr:Eukaryotic translation initiation factor 4B [Malassezia caprae]
MPAPKKNKMSLGDFLADETTGTSWADELDDLPSAPAPRDHHMADYGAADMGSRMPRSRFDGPPPVMREEPPLPTQPPFTAFVVNLSFDSTEGDVRMFFEPMNPISVRLVNGPDGRPRGYGYVEFETLDELKDALTYTGKPLANRNVRVSVAEPSSRALKSAAADDATQWRRSTPLPADDRRFGAPSGISGFEEMSISGDGTRSGFGAKFTPSSDIPRRRGPLEPAEPSASDVASDWRTGKPISGKPSRFGFGDREGGGRSGGFGGRRFDDDDLSNWRSGKPAAERGAATERRKLDLKPRTAPVGETLTTSSTGRSNPFGAAKPVDVVERQREIDEKIREQDRLRREQRAKQDEKKSKSFFKPGAADAWSTEEPSNKESTASNEEPSS